MFKPLKYQQGGKATSQEQLVQLFQAAAENAQVDPQQLVQKASEIGQDEKAAAQFMQGLQLCAQGDPEGIKFIKSLFQSPAFRKGGKIFDFICKHAKGGYVSGCGCGGNVKKAQDGAQFKAPTNYYNEKGWQISENNALKRNNRTFYTEEPTTAGNLAWANNQMSNQLMWPGIIQDVQYNQPVGHYIDEYGNIHNFSVEGNDLTRYNNRKAQWKKCGGKVEKAQDGKQVLGPNGKPVPKIPFSTSDGTLVDPKNIESLAKYYNTPFVRRDFNNPAGYAVERIITVYPNGQRDTTGIYNPANLSSTELEQMKRGEDIKTQALRQHFNKPGVFRAKK